MAQGTHGAVFEQTLEGTQRNLRYHPGKRFRIAQHMGVGKSAREILKMNSLQYVYWITFLKYLKNI